ncbi:MAG: hypothetical protein H7X97_09610 [Opitutaceae bacterium]|nr:hypothetical protein [Verrucomicrobiales bacterium]
MIPPPDESVPSPNVGENPSLTPTGVTPPDEATKTARILEEEDGVFSLEYDNTRGEKNLMSLDAGTYPRALREARSFLGIEEDNRDGDGALWDIE